MATCTDVYSSGGEEQLLWYLLKISLLDNLQGPIILWVHYYHISSFQANAAAVVLIYHLYPCVTLLLVKEEILLTFKRQGP